MAHLSSYSTQRAQGLPLHQISFNALGGSLVLGAAHVRYRKARFIPSLTSGSHHFSRTSLRVFPFLSSNEYPSGSENSGPEVNNSTTFAKRFSSCNFINIFDTQIAIWAAFFHNLNSAFGPTCMYDP